MAAGLRTRSTVVALDAIRWVAIAVGALAAAAGLAYLIVAAVGPEVWWPSGGSNATGAFVTFPLPLRLVNAGAFLLWNATTATMTFLVAGLARRIRRGVLFVPAVTRASWSLAITLAVGSELSQIVENVARGSALHLSDQADPANPIGAPIAWSIGTWDLTPNLPLLAMSVVLGLLAYVIGAGERLQRDTEGLI
jgi:hypothetical protein